MKAASRRTLLKSLAAGSGAIIAGKGLPDSWSRPVVDAVMLPAHAQTSGAVYSGMVIMNSLGALDNPGESRLASLTGGLVTQAHAGEGPSGEFFYFCATLLSNGVEVVMQGDNAWMQRSGLLAADGTEGTLDGSRFGPDCPTGPVDSGDDRFSRAARINSIMADQIEIDVQTRYDGWWRAVVQLSPAGCLPFPSLRPCR